MTGNWGALRYLLARSAVNRAHVQLRRLKRPQYALAMLAAALYLYWIVLRRAGSPLASGPAGADAVIPAVYVMAFETLLVLSAALAWLFGGAEPALAFTRADVQLLFPAPVSRATLVRLKLVQAQLPILFTILLWLALSAGSSPLPVALRAVSLWSLFTALYLHRVGASFVKVSAAQRGVAGLRRHAVPVVLVTAALAAAGWGLWQARGTIVAAMTAGSAAGALAALRSTPALRVVLWPFHALVAPVFAADPASWAVAMVPSVLVLALCYAWVVAAGVGFEEAAMQRADRLAAQRARGRTAGAALTIRSSRPWFPLRLTGRPWVAILWKNVTAFQRTAAPRRIFLVGIAGMAIAASTMPRAAATLPFFLLSLSLFGLVWSVLFGAVAVRADLQQDMLQLPLLRSFPLRGAEIVGAEVGASTAVLVTVELALLPVAFLSTRAVAATMSRGHSGVAWLLPATLASAFAVPTVTAVRVAVANAWAVLLPGWVRLGPERQAGIEALGQNLVSTAGSLITTLLLLAPPAAAALALRLLLPPAARASAWSAVPMAVVLAAAVAIELFFFVRWLGRVLERTDPSAVEAATA
ncbi:MAG TPA: putative ABC exporter domain-containing protein [Gemmatimonadaceae bacterium]|nr:putative ABC exporter domain-containing protein [Gemmatimonadaceae bacterium]